MWQGYGAYRCEETRQPTRLSIAMSSDITGLEGVRVGRAPGYGWRDRLADTTDESIPSPTTAFAFTRFSWSMTRSICGSRSAPSRQISGRRAPTWSYRTMMSQAGNRYGRADRRYPLSQRCVATDLDGDSRARRPALIPGSPRLVIPFKAKNSVCRGGTIPPTASGPMHFRPADRPGRTGARACLKECPPYGFSPEQERGFRSQPMEPDTARRQRPIRLDAPLYKSALSLATALSNLPLLSMEGLHPRVLASTGQSHGPNWSLNRSAPSLKECDRKCDGFDGTAPRRPPGAPVGIHHDSRGELAATSRTDKADRGRPFPETLDRARRRAWVPEARREEHDRTIH